MEELVRRFYAAVWNRWDDTAVNELLHERFVFRGSLGEQVRGRDGFRSYRDKIRTAFPDFHNEIVDLVTSGDRAAARLCYSGHQQGEVLGVAATGVRVVYEGAAFFTPRDGQLAEVWVLGDVDGLRHQLAGGSGATP
ncbi:MAG TPA: ester cyclase [Actinomycetes bacterium]|nr:ester cyclase [Actinomycetes bacterium]